jgi:hypothetical protein
MDAKQFDELVARIAEGPSRRDALKGAIGGALASIGISAALDGADAKGKGKGKGGGGGNHGAGAEKHKHHHKHKRNRHAAKKCKKGKKHCGNKKKCFDLQTSNDHCGNCGTSCLSTEQCVAGVCTPVT